MRPWARRCVRALDSGRAADLSAARCAIRRPAGLSAVVLEYWTESSDSRILNHSHCTAMTRCTALTSHYILPLMRRAGHHKHSQVNTFMHKRVHVSRSTRVLCSYHTAYTIRHSECTLHPSCTRIHLYMRQQGTRSPQVVSHVHANRSPLKQRQRLAMSPLIPTQGSSLSR